MNNVMSFDVSSVCTGWSYFRDGMLHDFGLITRDVIKDFSVPQKLFIFKKEAHKLLKKHKPSHVIIEETYLKNVKTLKNLMQFTGVLQESCYELLCLEPIFLHVMTVRSRFSQRTKEDVFHLVKELYKPLLDDYSFKDGNDITDSILQALYYYDVVLNVRSKEGETNV